MTSDNKNKRLGRGLDALFGDEEEFEAVMGDGSDSSPAQHRSAQLMGVDQLQPGQYQPRRTIDLDSVSELAESIKVHGVLQPLLVRKLKDSDGYEIIAGERRWRASQAAQLHEVPVIIKEMDDLQVLEVALIENLQREDLDPLEEALGYKQLVDEFGHTQEQVAKGLGKSRSHISNMMRLLTLPDRVQAYIRSGKLTMGHARALVTADDPEALAEQIVADNLSVRDAEKFAKGRKSGSGKSSKPSSGKASSKDIDTLALESEISGALGMKFEILMKDEKQGQVTIDFKDLDQLDDLLYRLSGK